MEVNYCREEAAVILRRNRFRDWISSLDEGSFKTSTATLEYQSIPQKSGGIWHLHASVLARVETK